jgi:serine/threonine protein phosphatase PrpC
MTFLTGSVSKRGGRGVNQDACGHLALEDGACWIVADGLGGHRGGEIASRLAVDAALSSFRTDRRMLAEVVAGHILAAHRAIIEGQQGAPELAGMRTTIVVLVSDYRSFISAHVGDSRLYYLRGGRITFRTKDHSVPQALADGGEITPEEIRGHVDRNRLLRSLGTAEVPQTSIEIGAHLLSPDDAFMLCVDGFWEYVLETEMEVDFATAGDPADWLGKMERRIIQRADAAHDNYTALAAICNPAPR